VTGIFNNRAIIKSVLKMNFIELHSGSPESFLNFLIFPLLLLPSSLLIFEDNVGRVDRRFF
jgi:hypothetical protein